MGEVYLANDTDLERHVALKVLLDEIAGDEDRVARFIQEAKAASALNHPNILTVFDIGVHGHTRFIATELIRGRTLRERLRGDAMTVFESLDIALQAAAALNAAHGAGIIHRDIKPENIMVRDDGLVKVLDFGLAKLTEKQLDIASPEDETLAQIKTQPGIVMGTVAYMSPEQARGHKLDVRTDIFSLGIVMFELFTGKRPFSGDENVDLISSILKDEPEALRKVSPNLPRHLERIVEKTLRKDRELRYQSVKDLHIDLVDLRDELKFEEKLGKSAGSTTAIPAHLTDADQDGSVSPDRRSVSSIPYFPSSIVETRRFTIFHFFLFAVLAAVVAGGAWWFGFHNSNNTPPPGSYKVSEVANWISAPGELFSSASFSPNGGMIAYSSTRGNAKNLWVTQVASTDAIQVTNDSFSNKDPIWSPKGDEIAYFSDKGNTAEQGGNRPGIWRVGALGGTPRAIGPVSDGSSQLRRWTPGGKIYYQITPDLYALDIASGTSKKITSFGDGHESILWIDVSPDEKTIAYLKQTDGTWQIYTANFNGGEPKLVTQSDKTISTVVWLPEKNLFFYSANLDGVAQIYRVGTDSRPSVRLTASDTDSDIVDASSDGHSVLFSSVKEESTLWRVSVKDDGEEPLARNVNSELWPAGSPDSLKVAFQSVKNLSQGQHLFDGAILVKAVDSGVEDIKPTTVTDHGFLPAWAPNGSAIAFLRTDANGKTGLFVVNPDGSGEKQLVSEGMEPVAYAISPYNTAQISAFSWSPDSSRITYAATRNGISNIWAVTPADGSETQISENIDPEQSVKCPVWATDGNRVAFYMQSKKRDENGNLYFGLGVADIRARQTLSVLRTDRNFRFIGWTSDEKGLIIAATQKTGNPSPEAELSSVALDGGGVSKIISINDLHFYNIFLSPDRKNIAFVARQDNKDDIWMVPSTGGVPKKLTDNNDAGLSFSRISWMPNGTSIVFGKQTRFSLLSRMADIN